MAYQFIIRSFLIESVRQFDLIFIHPVNNSTFFNFSQPTRDDRGWFVTPLGPNPWWTVIAAIIPALLCTILIFMDQQITAVIINRKEHKLKVYFNNCFNVISVTYLTSIDVHYTLPEFFSHLHCKILKYFQICNFIFYIHRTFII